MDTNNRYSVLLVDDEEDVIQIIVKKLDWEAMGLKIIGHAANGVEALELAEELQRKVTIEELMEETGMSRKMIEDAVRMSGFKIEDIDNNAKDSL